MKAPKQPEPTKRLSDQATYQSINQHPGATRAQDAPHRLCQIKPQINKQATMNKNKSTSLIRKETMKTVKTEAPKRSMTKKISSPNIKENDRSEPTSGTVLSPTRHKSGILKTPSGTRNMGVINSRALLSSNTTVGTVLARADPGIKAQQSASESDKVSKPDQKDKKNSSMAIRRGTTTTITSKKIEKPEPKIDGLQKQKHKSERIPKKNTSVVPTIQITDELDFTKPEPNQDLGEVNSGRNNNSISINMVKRKTPSPGLNQTLPKNETEILSTESKARQRRDSNAYSGNSESHDGGWTPVFEGKSRFSGSKHLNVQNDKYEVEMATSELTMMDIPPPESKRNNQRDRKNSGTFSSNQNVQQFSRKNKSKIFSAETEDLQGQQTEQL